MVLDVESDLRLVLIGDSGTVGTADTFCSATSEISPISPACRDTLWSSIAGEEADAVFALGDLVYDFGPTCGDDLDDESAARLDALLGDLQVAVDSPLILAIGNHDVGGSTSGRAAAEDCYRTYAAARPGIHFPERNFLVHAGPATVAVLDTNRDLGAGIASEIASAVQTQATPWTLFAAHHVWKTYDDKEGQDHGPRFTEAIGVTPDAWLNGHAHFLQMGVYDTVPAVTSGSASKLRPTTDCGGSGAACDRDGLEFSAERYGYAVLDVTETQLTLTFKNVVGEVLFTRPIEARE